MLNSELRTKDQLLDEIVALKSRISQLEKSGSSIKPAEKEPWENTGIVQSIIDSSSDVVHILDVDGIVLFTNTSFKKRMGLESIDIVGKNIFDYSPVEGARSRKTALEKVFQTGKSLQFEDIGLTGIFDSHLKPIYNSDRKIIAVAVYARDITDKKEKEKELKRSHQLYKEAQLLSKTGNWEYDLIKDSLYWSDEIYSIFGIDKDSQPLSIEYLLERIHPEDRSIVRDLIENQANYRAGYRIIMDDGSVKYLKEDVLNVMQNGKLISIRGTCQDITESTENKNALVKNQYYLKKAQEIGLIGTWELNIVENTLTWTDQAYKIFGIPLETEMNLELFLNCIHPDDIDYVMEKWNAALKHEPYDIEHRVIVNDKIKWVREKAYIDFDIENKPIRGTGFVQDITERKLAEKERASYSRIFEDSLNEIFLFDFKTFKLIQVNAAAQKNLGYTVGELQELTPIDFKPEYTKEQFVALIKPLQDGEVEIVVFETVHQRKDGTLYDVEIHLQLVRLEQETFFAAIILDITHRKKVETKLKLNPQQLQERNRELDAFSHTVAHDLKNPLGTMMGFVDLMIEDYPSLSDDQILSHLNAIMRSGEKTQQIIDSLLLFASIRKEDVIIKEINMGNIIDESIKRLSNIIKDHKAIITLTGIWPNTMGYAPWIEEVWVNYISNAIKYGGSPPQIEIGTGDGKLKDIPKGMVCFWVRDNGLGISAKNQELLFENFERLDQAKIEGHGLGLSIVRRIIEKIGGTVGLESEKGKGSLFYFTLPHN